MPGSLEVMGGEPLCVWAVEKARTGWATLAARGRTMSDRQKRGGMRPTPPCPTTAHLSRHLLGAELEAQAHGRPSFRARMREARAPCMSRRPRNMSPSTSKVASSRRASRAATRRAARARLLLTCRERRAAPRGGTQGPRRASRRACRTSTAAWSNCARMMARSGRMRTPWSFSARSTGSMPTRPAAATSSRASSSVRTTPHGDHVLPLLHRGRPWVAQAALLTPERMPGDGAEVGRAHG